MHSRCYSCYPYMVDFITQTPTYVKELLTFSNNSFYNLRFTVKKSIVNDKPNTKFKSNSFSYFGMKTWNELPKCIIIWKVLKFG